MVAARSALLGAPQLQTEIAGVGELLELGLEAGEGVPVAAHQQQHGELRCQARSCGSR